MIEIWRVGYGREASSPPDAPPGAMIATSAATPSAAPMSARVPTLKAHYPLHPARLSCRAVSKAPLAVVLALLVAACGGEKKQAGPVKTPTPAVPAARDANGCSTASPPQQKSV